MKIEVLGKEYGLSLTLLTRDLCKKYFSERLEDLIKKFEDDDSEAIAKFVWLCMKTHATIKQEEFSISYHDIYYNMSLTSQALQKFMKFVNNEQDEEEKKITN